MTYTILVLIILLILLILIAFGIFSFMISRKVFFCAFPRLEIYGDPNKMRFVHLDGFLFYISNDLWGKDIVFQSEATNMMFKYNLKPTMYASEILNNKRPLNIDMLDTSTNKQLSYSVPHGSKPQAIRFFMKYRDLMQRIGKHNQSNL
ncbi:hypothetical protein IKE67_07505 [bacterium]|nr:hypothetical protein [bacterium]